MDSGQETVYVGSVPCPGCSALLTPLEKMFSGTTGLCVRCRNAAYEKQAKSAMSIRR